MILSNFRDYERTGTSPSNWKLTAKVDVTTGSLWWKKTVSRGIARSYAGHWFFLDDGSFTPGYQAENLSRPLDFERGWY